MRGRKPQVGVANFARKLLSFLTSANFDLKKGVYLANITTIPPHRVLNKFSFQ